MEKRDGIHVIKTGDAALLAEMRALQFVSPLENVSIVSTAYDKENSRFLCTVEVITRLGERIPVTFAQSRGRSNDWLDRITQSQPIDEELYISARNAAKDAIRAAAAKHLDIPVQHCDYRNPPPETNTK